MVRPLRIVITGPDPDDPEFDVDAELAPTIEKLRMLFAEAGYPHAAVYNEGAGIFVDDVPEDVKQRAFDLINALPAVALGYGVVSRIPQMVTQP